MLKRFVCLCLLLGCLSQSHGEEKVSLRGYGKVVADFQNNQVSFKCENREKAEILYAKLLRDLTMMGVKPLTTELCENIPILLDVSGKALAIGLQANNVVVVEDRDKKSLLNKKILSQMSFPEKKKYPVFFDYYDLRALKFYKSGMSSHLGYGLEHHWPFAKKYNIEGFVLHNKAFSFSSMPAEDIVCFTSADYELEQAKEANGLVTFCGNFGASLPLWAYNLEPKNTAKAQTSTVVSEWQHGVEAGTYQPYGTLPDPEKSPLRAFQAKVMKKYKDNPNLGGWQLYCGAPIGDQLGMGMSGVLWDSSDIAKKAFRKWLKEHFSLKELGKRWKDDENAYKNWDEVEFLQLMDLIGGSYEKDRLLLSSMQWQWRVTPSDGYGKPPAVSGKWLDINLPPSQRCNYLETGSGYYRLKLPASSWITANKDKTLYLKAAVYRYDSSYLQGWVNKIFLKGKPVHAASTKMTHLEIPAGTLRGDGNDEIIIQTPTGRHRGDGRVHGPISLSAHPAENVPYSDPTINARYFDAVTFQNDMLTKRNMEMYKLGRMIDPNRPFSISGADVPILSPLAPFCGEQGISMQSTSIDAFFFPSLSSWGSLYGFYFTAEPSASLGRPKKDNFDSVFGQTFYQGASASAIFMDIEEYMKLEKETGKMTKRAPLLTHFGKYLAEQAQIGLLNTTQTHLLGGSGPWNWNLARGELPSAHYPPCMITENELFNEKAFQFPVIIDSSNVMTPKTVDAIKKYVEQGGTFIAVPISGMHSVLQQNAQMLSKLTGFKVDNRSMHGKIIFDKNQTVFPKWRGKEFNGNGDACDWKYNQIAKGVRLKKESQDAEVIARWDDGSDAIGSRKIGKGRIIIFGTGFFRNARDLSGKFLPEKRNVILEDMLAQLGVKRSVYADTPFVWLRKAVTKNGLEDWVIAHNVSENKKDYNISANIQIESDYVPEKIVDGITGETVPFTMKGNTITLTDTQFGKHETKIFAMKRPIPLTESLRVWWDEKKKYWRQGATLNAAPIATDATTTTIPINTWKFTAESDVINKPASEWGAVEYVADSWRDMPNGSWKILDPKLKDYSGVAIYRKEFVVPKDWRERQITFNFDTRYTIRDKAEFYLNGKLFASHDRKKQHPEFHGVYSKDITSLLSKSGKNVLTIKLHGSDSVIAGIGDTIWFGYERELDPKISLDGKWELVKKDLMTCEKVDVPGKFRGRYIRRRFNVPEEWRGKRVFLRLQTPVINIGSIMINEQAKALNGAFPPLGMRAELNISELVKYGQENSIELWHRHTIPTNWIGVQWKWPKESTISVDHVVIGVEK